MALRLPGLRMKKNKFGHYMVDLIEVRSGSYLEEDDIIRFQDRYGRV